MRGNIKHLPPSNWVQGVSAEQLSSGSFSGASEFREFQLRKANASSQSTVAPANFSTISFFWWMNTGPYLLPYISNERRPLVYCLTFQKKLTAEVRSSGARRRSRRNQLILRASVCFSSNLIYRHSELHSRPNTTFRYLQHIYTFLIIMESKSFIATESHKFLGQQPRQLFERRVNWRFENHLCWRHQRNWIQLFWWVEHRTF